MARDFYNDSFEEYDENDEFDECDKYEDDYECDGQDGSYEWTEEDSWDTLTDGMYGDMPSNPMDYDAMMDALGY